MDVEFKKDYAYGTTARNDGLTHIFDENKKRGVLNFSVTETYIFDENDPNADAHLLDLVIRDLERLKDELEKLRGNRVDRKHSKELEL